MTQLSERQRHHDADAGALRDDGRGQGAQLVGKPFVGRVQCHGIGRPLAGTERDARGDDRRKADGPEHRELGQGPDEPHDQQRPARLDPVDDKAGDDSRDRKQQEKARAEQAELARARCSSSHDRHRGDADHRLVGEVDHHEQEQERDDQPGPRYGRRGLRLGGPSLIRGAGGSGRASRPSRLRWVPDGTEDMVLSGTSAIRFLRQ